MHVEAMEQVEQQLKEAFVQITARASDEIIRSNSEWGAWIGRLACEEKPANYVEIGITGYEGPHQLQYEMYTFRDNVLVDANEIWLPVEADNFADSIKANMAKAAEEMSEGMKKAANTVTYETNGKFVLYSNNLEHTLEEHTKHKENAGYEASPEQANYFSNLKQEREWEEFVKSHADLLESKAGGKQTLVINAYGGAGAGKTTSCLQITEELKKAGYVAEYVQEYAKDLVWEENWDMLNGTQEHQFEILKEQLRRMDRLVGKVDFIVTDSPILLNAVYNKELTASYEKMLSDLYSQYKSFNFVVERDASKFEQEGRIHNLEESIEKDGQIKEFLKKNGLYFGTYNHSTIEKVVNNAIKNYSQGNSVEIGRDAARAQANEKEKPIPDNQSENQKPKDKPRSTHKGFAYTKNSDKPQVVFGDSKEDILKLLHKWNESRKPAAQYVTCNIGKLNPETQKYENYEKLDVQSGEAVKKNIYLQIPKNLSQEEFSKTLQLFKENGAKYNPYKKGWYIGEELKDKFTEYLPTESQEEIAFPESQKRENAKDAQAHSENVQEEIKNVSPAPVVLQEGKSALDYINSIDVEHVVEVDLNTGERLRISGEDILKVAGVEKWEELNAGQVVVAVDQKIQEHLQLLDEMKIEHLQEDMRIGENVTLYTPDYQTLPSGFKEICGMKEISGELREISSERYVIAEESGKLTEIRTSQLYEESQAEIMKRAIGEKFSPEKMDLIGQPELSAEQMEQVFKGFQDGLNTYQVAMYANSSYSSWQMDVYRYGMSNGIPFDNVQVVVQNHAVKSTGWEDSKKMVDKMVKAQRNLIIKDLKDNKIPAERQLVKRIEKLNGLTGKIHTVKDVMKTLKEGKLPGGEPGKLMGDIGKDISHQWKRMEAAALSPKVPIR